jgi:hypothetical protein
LPLELAWKFVVQGMLTRGVGGAPLEAYDVIVESGKREGVHAFSGKGPIAHPEADRLFRAWYFTVGADRAIEAPETVAVFLRIARGEWKPYVIRVQESSTRVVSRNELHMDLGAVAIDKDQSLYVPEP